jgi:hypothetical protein
VFPHGLHGDEVKEGRRLKGRLELGEAAMVGHLDKDGLFAFPRHMGGPEGHNVSAHKLAALALLLDLRRLRHEVDGAICALEDEKGPASSLVLCSPHHAPVERHSWRELGEELRCIGIDQKLAVAGHPSLELAGQLHLLERGSVVLGQLEGALADALCEAQAGQEPEPPQELEAELSGGLRARDHGLELDSPLRVRSALEHTIKLAKGLCLDRAFPGFGAVVLAPETEDLGSELLAPKTNPVAHVLPRHTKDHSLLASAPDRDVDVGVGGIEVLDPQPLEAEAQVSFHRRHELARVLAEIESLSGLGGDDELPKTRISRLFPLGEAARDVDPLLPSVEAEAALSLLVGAFACEVPAVGPPVGAAAIRCVPHLDNALLQQRR